MIVEQEIQASRSVWLLQLRKKERNFFKYSRRVEFPSLTLDYWLLIINKPEYENKQMKRIKMNSKELTQHNPFFDDVKDRLGII